MEYFAEFVKKHNYTYELAYGEKVFKDSRYEDLKEEDLQKYITNPKYKIKDYQFASCKAALNKKRGILDNSVGSGKTMCSYLLTRAYLEDFKKVLIVVPSIGLVIQSFKDFKEYGWDDADDYIAMFGDGNKKDYSKDVVISTFHSLGTEDSSFFEKFDCVIIDEAHRSVAKTIEYIQRSLVNCKNRIGMTGSLQEDKHDQMLVKSYLGPVLYTVRTKELQDRGDLAKLKIKIVEVQYSDEDREKCLGKSYDWEKNFINKHKKRNDVLLQIINSQDPKNNILIMAHELDHLHSVEKFLKENGKDVNIIEGIVKVKDRDKVIKEMESKDGILTLATIKSSGTGMSIKKINVLINFGSWGKSAIENTQVTGRGVRKIEFIKEECVFYDFFDDLTLYGEENYCYKHGQKRLENYKKQQFEDIEILKI